MSRRRTTLRAETINSAATEFNVSTCRNPADLSSFDRFVTVVVSTGACGVQSYLTPDECDELAAMLVQAAKEQREIIATPTQQVAA